MIPAHARLDSIAKRAGFLLRRSSDPEAEMRWAEQRLFEANLLGFDPDRSSPATWANQAIGGNWDIAGDSLFYLECRGSHPERAQSFEELVLSLIPSEGGL
jgi:hypothetical protein